MKKNVLSLLPILIIVTACSTFVDVNFDMTTFEQEQKAWNEAKITKYEYTYESWGEGGELYKVRVNNDKCEIIDEYSGKSFFDDEYRIENIYKKIKSGYDWSQGTEIKPCEDLYFYYSEIIVKYDTTYHIPLTIRYIYEAPENLAVDGTFYYKLTDFKVTE